MPCCLCFSDAPLNENELKGQRAVAIGRYVANVNTFQTKMIDTPCSCATLPCCLISCCPYVSLCVQIDMRHRVLNHVSPGSGWTHYQCCQGHCPVCCFKPSDTPHTFPRTCMCLEAFCCTGLAASATSFKRRCAVAIGAHQIEAQHVQQSLPQSQQPSLHSPSVRCAAMIIESTVQSKQASKQSTLHPRRTLYATRARLFAAVLGATFVSTCTVCSERCASIKAMPFS